MPFLEVRRLLVEYDVERLEEVRRPATRRDPEDRLADELRARTFDVR